MNTAKQIDRWMREQASGNSTIRQVGFKDRIRCSENLQVTSVATTAQTACATFLARRTRKKGRSFDRPLALI